MVKDRVAIVTGASRGIGLEVARPLAEWGAHVACVSTRIEGAQAIADQLMAEFGVKAIGIAADVSDEVSVQAMCKVAVDYFGKVDILVNNAGIHKDNLLIRMTTDEWQAVVNTNLNSVFFSTKSVLRTMMKQKYGRIVNIASVVGVMGNAGQANYAAAKAGVIGFSKSVAREYGTKGITCNVVAPGFIQTDMVASLPKEYLDNIIQSVPQQRLGSPRDVANLVLYLASDLSGYVTGEVIRVDGGMRT
jgi:3-oxoacyl-[acyl-carrier protein] reductase